MRRTKANTVRIIGGVWRSRILKFPDAADLRPTPDRVRETLFNWLGRNLAGAACLDLFAGSGALGFEALSRGAASVVMVETNAAALRALRENATKLGAENVTIVRGDALERTLKLVAEFVARGPTAAELSAAKKSMIGGFPLRYDTNRKVLEQVASIGFYGLPLDWLDQYPARIQSVTLTQIRDAFARRVDPAKLSIVVVGAPD